MNNTNLEKRLKKAFQRSLELAGTQKELERKTGVPQGNITNFVNGHRKLVNMTLTTLAKLFPEMEISFFAGEREPAVAKDYPEEEKRLLEYFRNLTDLQKLEHFSEIKKTAEFGKSKNMIN